MAPFSVLLNGRKLSLCLCRSRSIIRELVFSGVVLVSSDYFQLFAKSLCSTVMLVETKTHVEIGHFVVSIEILMSVAQTMPMIYFVKYEKTTSIIVALKKIMKRHDDF